MRTMASSNPRPERMWRTAGGGVVDAVEPRVLGQVAEAAGAVHDAGVGVCGAAQHLEQARLAGPVAADQADLVAGADREAGSLEDDGATHLDGELADLQHRTMLTGTGPEGEPVGLTVPRCAPTLRGAATWWRRRPWGTTGDRPGPRPPTASSHASRWAPPGTCIGRARGRAAGGGRTVAVGSGPTRRRGDARSAACCLAALADRRLPAADFFGGVRLGTGAIGTVVGVRPINAAGPGRCGALVGWVGRWRAARRRLGARHRPGAGRRRLGWPRAPPTASHRPARHRARRSAPVSPAALFDPLVAATLDRTVATTPTGCDDVGRSPVSAVVLLPTGSPPASAHCSTPTGAVDGLWLRHRRAWPCRPPVRPRHRRPSRWPPPRRSAATSTADRVDPRRHRLLDERGMTAQIQAGDAAASPRLARAGACGQRATQPPSTVRVWPVM